MANTYVLIASNTLTGTASSVTFSSIPATYTDLVLKFSARSDNTDSLALINLNGSSTSFSSIFLRGNGSLAASGRYTNTNLYGILNPSSYTTSTFSNGEIYIPSYTVSQNKPYSVNTVIENNATTAFIFGIAGLWSNTAAINEIKLTASGANFVSGSNFYLYGIKNS